MKNKLKVITISLILILSTIPSVAALEKFERIKGKNNYETAVKIADKKSYPSTAILVNMDNTIADGLSASALAGYTNGVILLTSKDSIPVETNNKLREINRIYLIGSENAISKYVEDKLKNEGKEVRRIGGEDRYETSYNIAKEIMGEKVNTNKVFIANGARGEADVVSISPVAYRERAPIILTNGSSISNDSKEIINNAYKRYIIGGTTVVPQKIENELKETKRIGGSNRYDTNKNIINEFYKNPKDFYIVDKEDYIISSIACSIATTNPIVLINDNTEATVLKGARSITAIGNISEKSISKAMESASIRGKLNYDWTKYRYIAHAMGGIEGKEYTNSKEAMEYNYQKGHRVFEVDLNYSRDGELIAWHSFKENDLVKMGMPREYSNTRPTLNEFKKTKIYGKYTTMSFEDIVKYMKKHKDMYLIIDSKPAKNRDIKKLYDKIIKKADKEVLNRIIPQAYNEVTYKQIMDTYNFNSIMITCYAMDWIDEENMTNLCAYNGIKAITVDAEKYSKSLVDKCNAKGIKLYMNTYNNKSIVESYKKKGVHGFFTDFLTP